MIFEQFQRGVVVVAHPDDEVLWAGGLLARYGFPVICCSIPRTDPERAWKFFDACKVLGTEGRILPYSEPSPSDDMKQFELLDLGKFHCIVTHNRFGEYGHRHHKCLNRFISERWPEKTFTFGWSQGACGDVILKLSEDEQDRKLAALKCYDHISRTDGKPKWQALLNRYAVNMKVETFYAPGLPNA